MRRTPTRWRECPRAASPGDRTISCSGNHAARYNESSLATFQSRRGHEQPTESAGPVHQLPKLPQPTGMPSMIRARSGNMIRDPGMRVAAAAVIVAFSVFVADRNWRKYRERPDGWQSPALPPGSNAAPHRFRLKPVSRRSHLPARSQEARTPPSPFAKFNRAYASAGWNAQLLKSLVYPILKTTSSRPRGFSEWTGDSLLDGWRRIRAHGRLVQGSGVEQL